MFCPSSPPGTPFEESTPTPTRGSLCSPGCSLQERAGVQVGHCMHTAVRARPADPDQCAGDSGFSEARVTPGPAGWYVGCCSAGQVGTLPRPCRRSRESGDMVCWEEASRSRDRSEFWSRQHSSSWVTIPPSMRCLCQVKVAPQILRTAVPPISHIHPFTYPACPWCYSPQMQQEKGSSWPSRF